MKKPTEPGLFGGTDIGDPLARVDQETPPFKLVRAEGPETSREAAYSIDTTRMESLVLAVIASFGSRGCISDEVRGALSDKQFSYSSVTARYKSLAEKGLISYKGTRAGTSGRSQRVMVAEYCLQ